MSVDRKALEHDLRLILGFTTVGPVRYPNLVLAQKHAQEWQAERVPEPGEERGGSSSPREVEERLEDRRVSGQAARAERELAELVTAFEQELVIAGACAAPTPELAKVAQRLARLVAWCVVPVDHDLLVEVPECRSCARPGKIAGRVFQGHKGVTVTDLAPKKGLCRYCYDAFRADGKLPPIDILDIYHRVGARAAGVEWAKRRRAEGKA